MLISAAQDKETKDIEISIQNWLFVGHKAAISKRQHYEIYPVSGFERNFRLIDPRKHPQSYFKETRFS